MSGPLLVTFQESSPTMQRSDPMQRRDLPGRQREDCHTGSPVLFLTAP